MNLTQRHYEKLQEEMDFHCKYGHLFCSSVPDGDCIDEYLSVRGLDNYGEPIEKEG